jgi:hypothetical protein
MATEIDKKKIKVAISRAETNIAELEVNILEREEDIERMKAHILLQQKAIQDYVEKLKAM